MLRLIQSPEAHL